MKNDMPFSVHIANARENSRARSYIDQADRWAAHWDEGEVYVVRDQKRRMVGFMRLWEIDGEPNAVIFSLTVHEAYREGGLDCYLLSEVARMTKFESFYADIEGVEGDQSKSPKVRYAAKMGFTLISADEVKATPYFDLANPDEETDPLYQAFLIASSEALVRLGSGKVSEKKLMVNTASVRRLDLRGWLQPTRESGESKRSALLQDKLKR